MMRTVTERLATELGNPDRLAPDWSSLEWTLATAAAAMHGVSPLLARRLRWRGPDAWHEFLDSQRAHTEQRHGRIVTLLDRLHQSACEERLAFVALKGSALHALDVYRPGERPMADIDILVRPSDARRASGMLNSLGFEESGTSWKERAFSPREAPPVAALGEHTDNPIKIELHERICEKLPLRVLDLSASLYPADSHPGLNGYPNTTALMLHLLFHAAGNMAFKELRLIHLHDLARLSSRLGREEWSALSKQVAEQRLWWAHPPLVLAMRYHRMSIPETAMTAIRLACPRDLRRRAKRRTPLRRLLLAPVGRCISGHRLVAKCRGNALVCRRPHPAEQPSARSQGRIAAEAGLGLRRELDLPVANTAHFAMGDLPARPPRQHPCREIGLAWRTLMAADAIIADPFREHIRGVDASRSRRLHLFGARVDFRSNNTELLKLVDDAYAGLPVHRLAHASPRLRITLLAGEQSGRRRARGALPIGMLAGAPLLGTATAQSTLAIVAPRESAALVVVHADMLHHAYHVRYELIEFAVCTLAARVQRLVPLHAACVGRHGRGILLMGDSGAGKSTVALHCLMRGMDFVAEDGVFVTPDSLLATGAANFLHLRSDSLRWLRGNRDEASVRRSPVIRRRSGIKKVEVDLRQSRWSLASAAPRIGALVFLSSQPAAGRPLLRRLPSRELQAALRSTQAYAAGQPQWRVFARNASRCEAFTLRRGRHPNDAVDALDTWLDGRDPP